MAENRGETQPVPERFRMDSPEVLAGFAELRDDIAAAMARGLLPATDVGALGAALTGVAFELAERVKAGADVEATTRFATALFLGGIEAGLMLPRAQREDQLQAHTLRLGGRRPVSGMSSTRFPACRGNGAGPPCAGRTR